MGIYRSVSDIVGRTPLLELVGFERDQKLEAKILAKLEGFNPAGSVKDRVANAMIEDAEARGLLREGSVIIEPTSGNTGIGLAAMAAARGYRVILTMPETMSVERRSLLKAYGAELVLTEGSKGMKGAIARAEELLAQTPDSFMPSQFTNAANPTVHFATTGPEIWEDTEGQVDIFVAGIGTGGTITGVGKYLKNRNPSIEVVAVEPVGSPVLSEGRSGPHKIQGIGAGFVPEVLDTGVYDRIIPVSDEDAFETAGPSPGGRVSWWVYPRARRSGLRHNWRGGLKTVARPLWPCCRPGRPISFHPHVCSIIPKIKEPREWARF